MKTPLIIIYLNPITVFHKIIQNIFFGRTSMSEAFSKTFLPADGFRGTTNTGHMTFPLVGKSSEIALRGHGLTQNLLNLESTDKTMNFISQNLLKLFSQNYKKYDVREDRYLNWNQLAPEVSYIHNVAMLSYLSNPLYNRPLGLAIQTFLFEDSTIIREKLSVVKIYIPHIATKTHPGTLSSQPVKHEIVRAFHDTRINSHIPIERRILREISIAPTILSDMFTIDNVEKKNELQPYINIVRENFTKQLKEACYLQIESLKKGKINNIMETIMATSPALSELKAIGESAEKNLSMEQIINNIINYKEFTMFGLTKQPARFMALAEDVFNRYTKVLSELNPNPIINGTIPVKGIIILSNTSKHQLEKSKLLSTGILSHEKDVHNIELNSQDLNPQNRFFTKNNLNCNESTNYKVGFNSPEIKLSVPGDQYGRHKMNFSTEWQSLNGRCYIHDDIDDVYLTNYTDMVKHPLKNHLVAHFHTQYNWLNPTKAGIVNSKHTPISAGVNSHEDVSTQNGPPSIGVYDKDANLLFFNTEKFKDFFSNPILYTDAFVECFMKYLNKAKMSDCHQSPFLKFMYKIVDKIENYSNALERLIKHEGKNYNYTCDIFKDVLYCELHPFFDLGVITADNKKIITAFRRPFMGSIPYYLLPIGAHFRRGKQLLSNIFPGTNCELNAPQFSNTDYKATLIWALKVIDRITQFCTSVFGEKMQFIHPAFSKTQFYSLSSDPPNNLLKDKTPSQLNILALCVFPVIFRDFSLPVDDQHKTTYNLYDVDYECLQIPIDIEKYKFVQTAGKRYNIMYETKLDFARPLFTQSLNKTISDITNSPCSHLEQILALFTCFITITPDSFNQTLDILDPGLGVTLVKAEVLQTDDIIFSHNEAQTTLMDIPRTEVINNGDNSTLLINSELKTAFMCNAINASATCYNHANLHEIKSDMGVEMHYYDSANVASGIIPPTLLQYEYFSSCKLAKERNKSRFNESHRNSNITQWFPIISPPHVPNEFLTRSNNPRGRNNLFMGLTNSETNNNWQFMFDHSIPDRRFREFNTTTNPWASQIFSLAHCMYSSPSNKINSCQNICYQKISSIDMTDIACFFDEPYLYKKTNSSCTNGNDIVSTISRGVKDWRVPGNSEKFPSKSNMSHLSKVATCSDNFGKLYGLSQPKFSFSNREIALEFLSKIKQGSGNGNDSLESVIYSKSTSYLIPGSTFLGPLERSFKLSEFLFHKST